MALRQNESCPIFQPRIWMASCNHGKLRGGTDLKVSNLMDTCFVLGLDLGGNRHGYKRV